MNILQDIVAIAQKALGESNNVTESDVAPILSDALEAIVELCQMEQEDEKHIVAYPSVWLAPAYRFGQSVIRHAHGGESLVCVIGMRHRVTSKWEYQVVEIIDGKPDVYCNGRWYPEYALSEVGK